MQDINDWKEQLEKDRAAKDKSFASASSLTSPIPQDERNDFKSLAYYAPDPDYRVAAKLHEFGDGRIAKIEDSGGNVREFLHWGELTFKIDGEECTLQIYKIDPKRDVLFVPFKDAGNGSATYGAGRFLDMKPEDQRAEDGLWILDFNKAYNPLCAYSHEFSCPYAPPANHLKIEIRAGEKMQKN